MKSVYSSSADLKALNGEFGEKAGNCKVQVLPICWRHHLDFPKQREVKREQDIGVTNVDEDACKSGRLMKSDMQSFELTSPLQIQHLKI